MLDDGIYAATKSRMLPCESLRRLSCRSPQIASMTATSHIRLHMLQSHSLKEGVPPSPAEIRHLQRVSGSQGNVIDSTSKQVQDALQHGHELWGTILDDAVDKRVCKRAPTFTDELASSKVCTQPKRKNGKEAAGG